MNIPTAEEFIKLNTSQQWKSKSVKVDISVTILDQT